MNAYISLTQDFYVKPWWVFIGSSLEKLQSWGIVTTSHWYFLCQTYGWGNTHARGLITLITHIKHIWGSTRPINMIWIRFFLRFMDYYGKKMENKFLTISHDFFFRILHWPLYNKILQNESCVFFAASTFKNLLNLNDAPQC